MNQAIDKLKAPAIGLIITGAINLVYGILALVSALIQWKSGAAFDRAFSSDAERGGYVVGFVGTTALSVLSALAAPFIIYGAAQMLAGKNYKTAKIAAVVAVIPLISCCFPLGVPFGIWALVSLAKPEVKAAFNGEPNVDWQNPPLPPQQF